MLCLFSGSRGHDCKVLFKSGRIYLRKPLGGKIKEFRLTRDLQVLLDDIVLLASCQACRGLPTPPPFFLNRLRVSAVIAAGSMPVSVHRLRCRGCGLPWCPGWLTDAARCALELPKAPTAEQWQQEEAHWCFLCLSQVLCCRLLAFCFVLLQ